jgi:hypothetical protein
MVMFKVPELGRWFGFKALTSGQGVGRIDFGSCETIEKLKVLGNSTPTNGRGFVQ